MISFKVMLLITTLIYNDGTAGSIIQHAPDASTNIEQACEAARAQHTEQLKEAVANGVLKSGKAECRKFEFGHLLPDA